MAEFTCEEGYQMLSYGLKFPAGTEWADWWKDGAAPHEKKSRDGTRVECCTRWPRTAIHSFPWLLHLDRNVMRRSIWPREMTRTQCRGEAGQWKRSILDWISLQIQLSSHLTNCKAKWPNSVTISGWVLDIGRSLPDPFCSTYQTILWMIFIRIEFNGTETTTEAEFGWSNLSSIWRVSPSLVFLC